MTQGIRRPKAADSPLVLLKNNLTFSVGTVVFPLQIWIVKMNVFCYFYLLFLKNQQKTFKVYLMKKFY